CEEGGDFRRRARIPRLCIGRRDFVQLCRIHCRVSTPSADVEFRCEFCSRTGLFFCGTSLASERRGCLSSTIGGGSNVPGIECCVPALMQNSEFPVPCAPSLKLRRVRRLTWSAEA